MPSPFPGMNPYLERSDVWEDFHDSYILALRDAIAALVQPRYFVRVGEHMYIRELPDGPPMFLGRPDVSVGRPAGPAGVMTAPVPARRSAPARVRVLTTVDEFTQAYLEVRDRANRELVTVIELLSPANKYAGADRDRYLLKREHILLSPAHFVELDFLRGGPRMPVADLPACDYYALVSRRPDRPGGEVWGVRLRDALPAVPIPLRTGEPEPEVDLQAVLHRVYDAAVYGLTIYDGDPEPRLPLEDAAWAQSLLPPAGGGPA